MDDDFLLGDGGSDTLSGYVGDDVILGGAASDQIFGDSGNDLIIGGLGSDRLKGDSGDDDLLHGDISAATQALIDEAMAGLLTLDDTLFQANIEPMLTTWRATRTLGGFAPVGSDNATDDMEGGIGADRYALDTSLDRMRNYRATDGDSIL